MPEFDSTLEYRPAISVPGEYYLFGNDGTMWSCRRAGAIRNRVGPWRELHGRKHQRGHRVVSLFDGNKKKSFYTHRLVLEVFRGACPSGMECCHGNGNPQDNRVENLRWGTRSENVLDSVRHGTHKGGLGGGGGPGGKKVITDEDVRRIRRQWATENPGRSRKAKELATKLAVIFGVSAGHVLNIANGCVRRAVV